MAQINLHTTPDFEKNLEKLMRKRSLKSKSDAIRIAVAEAAEKAEDSSKERDWSIIGWVHRLPGGWKSDKTPQEILNEIDQEMEEKLERLGKGIWTQPR